MLIQQTLRDATRDVIFAELEPEPVTDNIGALYRGLRREYGSCTGKVYVDTENEPAVPVGWVFHKLMCYDDCCACHGYAAKHKRYLREAWVTCQAEPDTRMVTRWRPFRIDRKAPVAGKVL